MSIRRPCVESRLPVSDCLRDFVSIEESCKQQKNYEGTHAYKSAHAYIYMGVVLANMPCVEWRMEADGVPVGSSSVGSSSPWPFISSALHMLKQADSKQKDHSTCECAHENTHRRRHRRMCKPHSDANTSFDSLPIRHLILGQHAV